MSVKFFKRIISLIIILTLLSNSISTAFGQVWAEGASYRPMVQDMRALIQEGIKSDIKVIDENFIRRAYQKEYNFHKLFESLNKQGFSNNYGEVCDEWKSGEEGDKICAPYHTFMRGVIGALIDFSEGEGEVLSEYTDEIKEAVYLGAVGSKDIEALRAGLIKGSKAKLESCSVRKAEYKKEDECQKGLSGLLILGVLWENEKGAKENADVIYKALKGNMKKAYGPLVMAQGIAALSYMDTDYSYSLIEKFLTDESMPSKVGEGVVRTLDLLSLSGIYDTWEAIISKAHKGGIRYLNRNNENWQYILEEETRKAGLDPIAIAKQNSEAMKWDNSYAETAYKVVYGNILTDIGEFLAQSNERGKVLSNKIISSYVYDNKVVHLPLILGLIKGKDVAFDTKTGLAARRLNEGFYYDLNGGTGRYVAVNSALKGSGLSWNHQNVVSYEYYKAKIGVSRVNFIGDMFINVVMSGMLVLSIPSIMKGIYNLGRLANRAVKARGAVKAGRIVKGEVKASPKATKPVTEPKVKARVKQEKVTKPEAKVTPKAETKPEGTLNKIRANSKGTTKKANNIFNKPYSQMNKVEKKIFDTYISLEMGGLGDLKAAIKDSKSLLTTRTGIKNTAASGLAFGTGEAPAVEARLMAKAPTEVVSTIEKGKVFENPVTLFDNVGINRQIGASGRAVSKMPNTFKGANIKPISLRQPGSFMTTINGGLATLRSTFMAPQGENPLLSRQMSPMRKAAAFTGLLIGAGLTATYGLPAAIGTTLALTPIVATNVGPQEQTQENKTASAEDNKKNSNGKRRIFGNSNKAKANLNLTQQELQDFTNAFVAFVSKDDVSKEDLLNFLAEQGIKPVTNTVVEHGTAGNDYEKTFKDFVAAFMALDFTKDPQKLAKQFTFSTGIDKFKFGGKILIKKGTATKDGTIKEDFQRINTLYVSAVDFKLKETESLVMDSYGNIYKLSIDKNGKQIKQYYQNVVATQVNIPGLDMPIVVIGKTIDKLAVLNFLFMLMGFSSLGRFVNGPIQDLWPQLPNVVAMALGTGIYFTNLLAVPFKPMIDKLGAKKMVALAIGEIITASLLPTLFGMSGFAAINPTTTKLAVLAITSILYGAAAAGLQQVVNTTANNMLGGKEAGYVTAGGQMFKSIGSLSTYLFYAVAVGLLGAQWPAMYWLMGIPGVIGAVLLGMSDLPLQKSKVERLQEAAANGDEAAQAELAAMSKGKKSAPKQKSGQRDLDFILSWGGLPIFAAIMLLCGSETLVSVTTKDLMKGWLGDMSFLNNDALQMAITGIITMGPALAGRLLAKSLMKKYKDVPQYNQKMLLITAAVATASAAAIKLLGPSAGLSGLLFVITSNMTLSNFFTFEANIMKNYNNEKFEGKFDSLVGTLTTMGIVGCFLVPTLASAIFPATATAFDKLIVPMLLIPAAMAIMIPHMKGANPLAWAAPMKAKDVENMSKEIAKDIEEAMAGLSKQEVANGLEQIKADMATELGITVEEVNTFLTTGILPNLSEENIKKLAAFWGVTNKDMKQFLSGENTDAVLEKIQKNMSQKIQETIEQAETTITLEDIEQVFEQ